MKKCGIKNDLICPFLIFIHLHISSWFWYSDVWIWYILSVPRIKIVDERHQEVEDRIFYDKGSTIKLKCVVENIVGEQPEYIIWKKGNRMLNYDTERGGIRWLLQCKPEAYLYIFFMGVAASVWLILAFPLFAFIAL